MLYLVVNNGVRFGIMISRTASRRKNIYNKKIWQSNHKYLQEDVPLCLHTC